jgi:hypothetical protein
MHHCALQHLFDAACTLTDCMHFADTLLCMAVIHFSKICMDLRDHLPFSGDIRLLHRVLLLLLSHIGWNGGLDALLGLIGPSQALLHCP